MAFEDQGPYKTTVDRQYNGFIRDRLTLTDEERSGRPFTAVTDRNVLVGSLASLLFAKRGYNVNLYEYREDIRKSSSPSSRGRTINLSLSRRGRAALARAGLEERVLAAALPLRGRMLHLVSEDGHVDTRAAHYDPKHHECIYSVGRKELNEMLLTETERYPNVKLHFHHKLVNADLDNGRLKFQQTFTGEILEVDAGVIVGADGAFSSVRRHLLARPLVDYSQQYIPHGYLELCIPPSLSGDFALPESYLHVWPHSAGEGMLIALPNRDCSWTVTLFLPFTTFDSLNEPSHMIKYFQKHFPDALQLIGESRLVKDFFKAKPSPLVAVKCRPYHVGSRAVIIGDAAHAMLPFYGQGMNAGFEDCMLLEAELAVGGEDALLRFSEARWRDAHAICDLAAYNFLEMRSLVCGRSWAWRRTVDSRLHALFGARWRPLYQAVAFSQEPYSECVTHRQWQDKVISTVMFCVGGVFVAVFILLIAF